eukprot:gene21020-27885_t
MMAGAGIITATKTYSDQKLQTVMKNSQQVAGKASVGGPFDLIDTEGKKFTDRELLGEFALLYFGFTHCPDICPDEMEKVAEVVDLVEKEVGVQVPPVFISIDPQRDTPQLVKSYVAEFHPRMLGLTGEFEKVKAASKAYRVYFNKTGDSDTDYLVDHSIIHYLIDPTGEFVTFYAKSFTAEQMAESITSNMAEWKKEHPDSYHPGKEVKMAESITSNMAEWKREHPDSYHPGKEVKVKSLTAEQLAELRISDVAEWKTEHPDSYLPGKEVKEVKVTEEESAK